MKKTFLLLLKRRLINLYLILKRFGIDLKVFISLKNYPRFRKDKKVWLKKNGKIDNEIDFENDTTIYYHENGKIKDKKIETLNVYHEISYYENGNLRRDTYSNYVSGVEYYKSFFENGQLEISDTNEERKSYFENGQLKEKGSYSSNDFQSKVKTGIWESFYENGQLKEKNQFDLRGNNIGWGEFYFENGLLKEKIFYSNIENERP